MRGPLARPPVPIALTRSQTFDELVLDAAERISAHIESERGTGLGDVAFVVEDVPDLAADPTADFASDFITDLPRDVPLGRIEERTPTTPPTVVVYRRPVEARAGRGRELTELVHDVVVEQVADLLGTDPDDVDPGYES